MRVQARDIHAQSLATSSALSEYYVPNLITPLEVIRILNAAKVRFMLLGAHGLGGWMGKPRATEDVDVLVGTRGHKKAVAALQAAFPHLQAEDYEVVTRFRDPETRGVVIDVMKPNQPLYRDALKYGHLVESGGQNYQIPSLELALATKFAAMISLTRADRDKFQDVRDFMYIVDGNPDIDLAKLHALGQLVYNNGGDEVVEMVRKVRAGEKLIL
ncbi:MAG TPA: nucleotidyl transferase AbiEii/AbiGii toxin family protein [Gemmataceae bacterium]|nr:nucleotidyl transferase AbiEii/AbiGii toxin family protein [Gemmataceae bacterium]